MKEKVVNWIITILCFIILGVCITNTIILFDVKETDVDDDNINSSYRDFVKYTNLLFCFIFFLATVFFLLRALSVSDIGWAKKIYERYLAKFDYNYRARLAAFREKGRLIQLAKSQEEIAEGEIIPADRKLGRPITISSSCDKEVPAPSIVGAAPVDNRITLGDFKYKESDVMATIKKKMESNAIKSPRRPLDDLKEYYIQQSKLKK
jgi:hypothetical protein